jgi:hypothetical protein
MKFKDTLKKLGACGDAVEWVADRTEKQAWAECKRGDWMMWLIKKSHPKKVSLAYRKKLVLCACDVAETSLKYVAKDEKRPAEAIRIARAWANGEKVTLKEVEAAANAAYAAANAANAAYAAYAAAYAAYAANAANAANAAYAAYAAAYAAYAANAANAAYAAYAAAYADIVRKYFKKA